MFGKCWIYFINTILLSQNKEPVRDGRFFHLQGLSDHHEEVRFPDDNQKIIMKPFDALLEKYHTRDTVVHYLKIDIEGDEWKVCMN